MTQAETDFRNSALRDDLKALLNHPTLKKALEIVGEGAKPRSQVEPRPHAPLDTLYAHRYQRQAGIQAALDHLERLTNVPPAEGEAEDELDSIPYSHGLPPDVKEAMRKKLQENQNHE